MKSPFDSSKIDQEIKEIEERLEELRAQQAEHKFSLFHPTEGSKRKKEIEDLEKQIDLLQKKKEQKKSTIILVSIPLAIIVLGFVILLILPRDKSGNDMAQADTETTVEERTIEVSSSEPSSTTQRETPIAETEATIERRTTEETTEKEIEKTTGATTTEATTVATTAATTETIPENSYPEIKSYTVTATREWGHDSEANYLGYGEGLIISILAKEAGSHKDDFLVYYPDEDASCEELDSFTTAAGDWFRYRITGKQPGTFEVYVASYYDFHEEAFFENEAANSASYSIQQLDSNNGRMVYVTPTGEKYHYSESCAGENAIAIPFYEVQYLDPCGTCVY